MIQTLDKNTFNDIQKYSVKSEKSLSSFTSPPEETTERLFLHSSINLTNIYFNKYLLCFPGGSDGKESTCNAGSPCSVPELGWSIGEGNGYPLGYSCLENSMDRGASCVHGVAKSSSDTTEQLTLSLFTALEMQQWAKLTKSVLTKLKEERRPKNR